MSLQTENKMKSKSTENKPSLLDINAIVKEFGYKRVLQGVTCSLFPDETTLLVGRNGAGKSTLIKILCGLMRPTEGQVLYHKTEISQQPEIHRKAIGVISHENLFYGDLTAKENLLFFGQLGKTSGLKQKVDEALASVNLENVADVPAKTFSSGMGKRLNIARLMVLEPEILFLDEPYSGLDFDSMELLNRYLVQVKARGGSILLISHQVDICFENCDRVIVLADGLITEDHKKDEITPQQLLSFYQTSIPTPPEGERAFN